MRILDKNCTEIQPGQRLSITYCVGPYGQLQTDVGTVEFVDERFRGVTIKLEARSRQEFRGAVSYLQPGECRYIALPGEFVGEGPAAQFVAHRVVVDFEHGHTAYAEVLPA